MGIQKNPSDALVFYLKNKGKNTDGIIVTQDESSGIFYLKEWPDGDIPRPNDVELNTIINDYESKKEVEETNKKNRKRNIMRKLGLERNDIQGLKELIQDGDAE